MTLQADCVVIGAGPVGLFAVFQAGMMGMKCHVVDPLPHIGGQCTALYPQKPIYDIPAYPSISGEDLIQKLQEQAAPFDPVYHLSQSVVSLSGNITEGFTIGTSDNVTLHAKIVIIAAGAGAFIPRRPPLKNIEAFENHSVFYAIQDKSIFQNKKIVIAGGGDSALDWANILCHEAEMLYLVHRRDIFRGMDESVYQFHQNVEKGKIQFYNLCQLHALEGQDKHLNAVIIKHQNGDIIKIETDYLLPFFGLSTQLGPIKEWNLALDKNHINITQATAETSLKGVYAVGDIATYPHKLKLILTGFSEVASAIHHAYHYVYPDKAFHFEHSTSKGVKKI